MCGKLQCENVETMPVFGIKPATIQTPIKGNTCWGVDFQLGSDVPDPGMVNEGTKCAPGKVKWKRSPCGSRGVVCVCVHTRQEPRAQFPQFLRDNLISISVTEKLNLK